LFETAKGSKLEVSISTYTAFAFKRVRDEKSLALSLFGSWDLIFSFEVASNAGAIDSARILAANGGTEFPICLRTSVIDPINSKSSG
jgi:hypothetical protein